MTSVISFSALVRFDLLTKDRSALRYCASIVIRNGTGNGGGKGRIAPHYRMDLGSLIALCETRDKNVARGTGSHSVTAKSYDATSICHNEVALEGINVPLVGGSKCPPVYKTVFDWKVRKTNTPKKQTEASADNPFIWMNGEAVGNA